MKCERVAENIRPPSKDCYLRMKVTGNVVELLWQNHKSVAPSIRKINSELYEDLRTGEVKEFHHIENRSEDLVSVSRSLSRLRDLLNTNVTDVKKCRWVTLTYADNMTDPERLYCDFKEFNRRHRKRVGHYEYIAAAEPQGRGAWHLHVVMIFDHKAPYIKNADMSADWRQGFVTVKKLDDVDNVGAYLTAYLGDMELNQETIDDIGVMNLVGKEVREVEVTDNRGKKSKKSFIKGARLHMYPPQFNLYRYSKGIKKPEIIQTTEEKAQKKVSSAKLTFEKTLVLSDTDKDFERVLNYRYYNLLRKKGQEEVSAEDASDASVMLTDDMSNKEQRKEL